MKKKAFNKLLSLIFEEIGKRLAPLTNRSKDIGTELDRFKPALEKMAKDIADLPITIKGVDGKTPTADELKELIMPLIPAPVKGDAGHTPTEEELKELIVPLIPAPVKGDAGHTPTEDELKELIVPLIPAPIEGKAPTEEELVKLILPLIPAPVKGDAGHTPTEEELKELIVPLIPAPVKGDAGHTPTEEELKELIMPLIPAPIKGEDGRSPTAQEVLSLVEADLKDIVASVAIDHASTAVEKALAEMPVPKDGKSVTVEDVRDTLSLMFSQWALEFERRGHDAIQRAIDSSPKPKDGMSFDELEFDGERRLTWKRGETVIKEIVLPTVIDRGVWVEGKYERGDAVSFGGNLWIARCDTDVKPGPAGGEDGNKHWRIAVRRGRDAKGR